MKFSADQIARARERHSLAGLIGRSVALKKQGGEYIGLCPFHREKTPSFHVVEEKGFYHCFGCGAHGDAIAWLMQGGGVSFRDAVGELLGEDPAALDTGALELARTNRAEEEMARRRRMVSAALATWHEAVPVAGTPGEAYFRGRGITLPLPASLKFHPRCAHGPKDNRLYLPAVVCGVSIGAAVGAASTVIAVHRIYLDTSDGQAVKTSRAPDKALLGDPGVGAIRLGAAAERLGLCEGVETGLSVQQATGLPVWSAIHGQHLANVALPETVRAPVILADRDPIVWNRGHLYGRRPGEYYASLASQRFKREGRDPVVALPGRGGKVDFNDLLAAGL